jgi:hypothetical protein
MASSGSSHSDGRPDECVGTDALLAINERFAMRLALFACLVGNVSDHNSAGAYALITAPPIGPAVVRIRVADRLQMISTHGAYMYE